MKANDQNTRLREVIESDLEVFYQHQADQQAAWVAAFKPRAHAEFMAHWHKILANPALIAHTVLYHGKVAGNVVSFDLFGKREVGYWIGREYWGKGIATLALSHFLKWIRHRPLYAHVAHDHVASIRVLEKCGFQWTETKTIFSEQRGADIEEDVFRLS